MTFNTNIPNAAQSPGVFPAQSQANFTRLKDIVSANHKFNDSTATDDGYHQNIQMLPIAVPGADNTIGQCFANSAFSTGPLTYVDQSNNRFQITPCLPMRAWVSFDSSGNILNSGSAQFNVSSVSVVGTGLYRVIFTTAMPSIFYTFSGIIIPSTSSGALILTVRSSSSYSEYVGTTDIYLSARRVSDGNNNATFQAATVHFFGG